MKLSNILILTVMGTLFWNCSTDPFTENKITPNTTLSSSDTATKPDLAVMQKEGFALYVAPNPVTENSKIICRSSENEKATFTLYTSSVEKVATIEKELIKDEEFMFSWAQIATLDSGVYSLEMRIDDDPKAVMSFLKIKR